MSNYPGCDFDNLRQIQLRLAAALQQGEQK